MGKKVHKAQMKSILIQLMPWRWQGAVIIGGTSKEFAAWAKDSLDIDIETGPNAAGHAHLSEGKPWLIWLETLDNIPALAHEALHITAGLLEARGLHFTAASEEAYTYTMEDIIRQTLGAKKWEKVK